MAGLNCEIRWETRLCEVDGELGYFHCWEHWSNVIDASPLRGGHPGGQIGQVYGIVEFTDGVRRVDPSKIKFCDEENALLTEMAKHHQEGNLESILQMNVDKLRARYPDGFSMEQSLHRSANDI